MAVVVVDETEGVVGEFGGEAEGVVAGAGAGEGGGAEGGVVVVSNGVLFGATVTTSVTFLLPSCIRKVAVLPYCRKASGRVATGSVGSQTNSL